MIMILNQINLCLSSLEILMAMVDNYIIDTSDRLTCPGQRMNSIYRGSLVTWILWMGSLVTSGVGDARLKHGISRHGDLVTPNFKPNISPFFWERPINLYFFNWFIIHPLDFGFGSPRKTSLQTMAVVSFVDSSLLSIKKLPTLTLNPNNLTLNPNKMVFFNP